MAGHLPDNKPLRILPKTIEAECYNQVRLALSRLGKPLRIAVPDHRGLDFILDDHCWLCVDSIHADQPILAYCNFATAERSGLYEAVACELRLYHSHAGLIMGTAIAHMSKALAQRLAPPQR